MNLAIICIFKTNFLLAVSPKLKEAHGSKLDVMRGIILMKVKQKKKGLEKKKISAILMAASYCILYRFSMTSQQTQ